MIKPSKKYLDYVKAINKMYNLGFFHQFEVDQEKFDALTIEQQNRLIDDVLRLRNQDEYVTLNDGRGTRMDKGLYMRIEANRKKAVKNMPVLGNVGWTGKPIYSYYEAFNPDLLTPQTKIPFSSNPSVIANYVRNGVLQDIKTVRDDCPYDQLYPDYDDLTHYVQKLSNDELLVMVEETYGCAEALDMFWLKYKPRYDKDGTVIYDSKVMDSIYSIRAAIRGIINGGWK